MRILEQDVVHGVWMLRHQISTANDLINFWMLFGPSIERGPSIEQVAPSWHKGLNIKL